MQCSVDWKAAVAEVLNLLQKLIDSAMSIFLVKLTFWVRMVWWVMWVLWVSCIAGRATKSEDLCDGFKPTPVHWLDDKPNKWDVVHCISITSDASAAVRSQVVLPMCANSLMLTVDVNVIDDGTSSR